MTAAPGGVASAVANLRERVHTAAGRAGRDAAAVRIIAVTKTIGPGRIAEVIAAGITDIGENRVQEAQRKHEEVAGARWHLVGHLQTNKARPAAAIFDAVHSIDSERVAGALALARPADLPPLAALIEVELTGLATRSGIGESEAEDLLRATAGLPGLHVLGLMTIAPPAGDPDEAREYFVRLRVLRDRLENATGWALPELSMGMSSDFEVAVEEGATMVRIGRAIFGERG